MKNGWKIATEPTALEMYNSLKAKYSVELTGNADSKIKKIQMKKLNEVVFIDETNKIVKKYQVKGVVEKSGSAFTVYLGDAINLSTNVNYFNSNYIFTDFSQGTINTAGTIVSFTKKIKIEFAASLASLKVTEVSAADKSIEN